MELICGKKIAGKLRTIQCCHETALRLCVDASSIKQQQVASQKHLSNEGWTLRASLERRNHSCNRRSCHAWRHETQQQWLQSQRTALLAAVYAAVVRSSSSNMLLSCNSAGPDVQYGFRGTFTILPKRRGNSVQR